MRTYIDLIKEEIIDFKKLLLEKYYLLSLNETEAFVVMRLYERSKFTNTLVIPEIVKKMSIKEDELGDIIAKLVAKGLLTLTICDENDTFTEEFSLEETYKELAYLLENNDKVKEKNEQSIMMKNLVKKIELVSNRQLSPFEYEIIRKWVYEYKYDIGLIESLIIKSSKLKKITCEMIDRMLYAETHSTVTEDDVRKAQELLEKKYGKSE